MLERRPLVAAMIYTTKTKLKKLNRDAMAQCSARYRPPDRPLPIGRPTWKNGTDIFRQTVLHLSALATMILEFENATQSHVELKAKLLEDKVVIKTLSDHRDHFFAEVRLLNFAQ